MDYYCSEMFKFQDTIVYFAETVLTVLNNGFSRYTVCEAHDIAAGSMCSIILDTQYHVTVMYIRNTCNMNYIHGLHETSIPVIVPCNMHVAYCNHTTHTLLLGPTSLWRHNKSEIPHPHLK